jgi:hypothetical protein
MISINTIRDRKGPFRINDWMMDSGGGTLEIAQRIAGHADGRTLSFMITVRVVPAFQISIDFTKRLSFESAPVSIFSQILDPGRQNLYDLAFARGRSQTPSGLKRYKIG